MKGAFWFSATCYSVTTILTTQR